MTSQKDSEPRPWKVYEFHAPAGGESELENLTHRILGMKDRTRRDVLEALRGQRKSHGELEQELGRNPGAVHRALSNLVNDGLLLQQVNARKRPVTRLYSLTPKGNYVLDLMIRYKQVADDTPFEVKTETGTYILYSKEVSTKGKIQRAYFFAKKGQSPKNSRPETMLPRKRLTVPHQQAPLID